MEKKEMWKVLGRDDYAHKSQELKKSARNWRKLYAISSLSLTGQKSPFLAVVLPSELLPCK